MVPLYKTSQNHYNFTRQFPAAKYIQEEQMRKAKIERKTKETDIKIELELDGTGKYSVDTSIPFLDHMLSLMCKHGLFDLKIKAKGDVEIDDHHTVEDTGIVLGKALKQALGDMKGINRYGQASVPMDEALATVCLDISGRAYLVYKVEFPKKSKLKDFDPDLIEDFLQAFVGNAGITLHAGRAIRQEHAPYNRGDIQGPRQGAEGRL